MTVNLQGVSANGKTTLTVYLQGVSGNVKITLTVYLQGVSGNTTSTEYRVIVEHAHPSTWFPN